MPRCPFALWKPIPPQQKYESWPRNAAEQKQTQLIVHSADGSYQGSIAWWADKFKWQVFSTFFVLNDGTLIQLVDSSYRAPANSTANMRAISVETEDYGDPDRRAWTPAQVKTLQALARWVSAEHDIPLVPCPKHDEPGIGIHTMWSDLARVNPWIKETKRVKAKTCPGVVRVTQFFEEILAGLGYPLRGDEVDEVFKRWSWDPRKRRPKRRKKKRRPRRRTRAEAEFVRSPDARHGAAFSRNGERAR